MSLMRALLVDYSRIVRRMQDFFFFDKRSSPFLLIETTLTRFRTNNRKTNFRLTKIIRTQFDQNKKKKLNRNSNRTIKQQAAI